MDSSSIICVYFVFKSLLYIFYSVGAKTVEFYDPATNKWQVSTNMDRERWFPCVLSIWSFVGFWFLHLDMFDSSFNLFRDSSKSCLSSLFYLLISISNFPALNSDVIKAIIFKFAVLCLGILAAYVVSVSLTFFDEIPHLKLLNLFKQKFVFN